MNIKKVRIVVDIVQKLAIIVGILGGGIWGLIRMDLFKEVQRQKLEIKEIEKSLMERAILDISIESESFKIDRGYVIKATVIIKNNGNRTEQIETDSTKLWVTKIENKSFDLDTMLPKLNAFHELPGYPDMSRTILPGQTRSFNYVVNVTQKGLYHLGFYAKVSEKECKLHEEEQGRKSDFIQWSASSYYNIE
jgi:hypothetical protein